MLLNWLGERHENTAFKEAADTIDKAIDAVLKNPKKRTADLGGPLGTQAFAAVVADKLRSSPGA
jgi:3-isopropylmalate dehydrogenase